MKLGGGTPRAPSQTHPITRGHTSRVALRAVHRDARPSTPDHELDVSAAGDQLDGGAVAAAADGHVGRGSSHPKIEDLHEAKPRRPHRYEERRVRQESQS